MAQPSYGASSSFESQFEGAKGVPIERGKYSYPFVKRHEVEPPIVLVRKIEKLEEKCKRLYKEKLELKTRLEDELRQKDELMERYMDDTVKLAEKIREHVKRLRVVEGETDYEDYKDEQIEEFYQEAKKYKRSIKQERDRRKVTIIDDLLCSICMDKQKDTVIFPCKHFCSCYDCAIHLIQEEKCPLCRGEITECVKIYSS